jgi:hypothetical protein
MNENGKDGKENRLLQGSKQIMYKYEWSYRDFKNWVRAGFPALFVNGKWCVWTHTAELFFEGFFQQRMTKEVLSKMIDLDDKEDL